MHLTEFIIIRAIRIHLYAHRK